MSKGVPVLVPVTPEARAAILRERIVLDGFPFRIGRESRAGFVDGALRSLERRSGGLPPNNDLYMLDRGTLLNVSREHFQIEKTKEGGYALVDRGSTCGTIVDGQTVGGQERGGTAPLKEGSLIRVGTQASPYLFKFLISAD